VRSKVTVRLSGCASTAFSQSHFAQMLLFETYSSGSLNCRVTTTGCQYWPYLSIILQIRPRWSPQSLMVFELPKQTIHNDLYYPSQFFLKWDSRMLASSLKDVSFWESTFFHLHPLGSPIYPMASDLTRYLISPPVSSRRNLPAL
jgi:hypothetical protein